MLVTHSARRLPDPGPGLEEPRQARLGLGQPLSPLVQAPAPHRRPARVAARHADPGHTEVVRPVRRGRVVPNLEPSHVLVQRTIVPRSPRVLYVSPVVESEV